MNKWTAWLKQKGQLDDTEDDTMGVYLDGFNYYETMSELSSGRNYPITLCLALLFP